MGYNRAVKEVACILIAFLTVVSLSVFVRPAAEVMASDNVRLAKPEGTIAQGNQFFWTDSTSTLGLTEFGTISMFDFPRGFEHLGRTPREGYAICYRVECDDDEFGAEIEPVFYVGAALSQGVLPCGANGDVVKSFLFATPRGSSECPGALIKTLRASSISRTCDGALQIRNIIRWVKGEKRVNVQMSIRNRTRNCIVELLSVKRIADLNVDCLNDCQLDVQCPQTDTEGCVNNFSRTSSSVTASNDPSACEDQDVHAVVMTGSPTPSNTLISGTGENMFDNLETCDPVGEDSSGGVLTGDRTATLHWNEWNGEPIILTPVPGKRDFKVEIFYDVK